MTTRQINRSRTLQHQIDQLSLKVANLQTENRHLRRKVKENAQEGRILRQAHRDALIMLSWHFSGLRPSRQFCLENGISRRHWAWARALLMCARLYDRDDLSDDVQPEDALHRLKATVERLERNGLEPMRARNLSYRKQSQL